jgi:mRNA interferase HigB
VTVRVIAKKILREFWEKHEDAEQPLKAWYRETLVAEWEGPEAIKKKYRTASFLPDNRVVFNIKGNNYRLIVKVNYKYRMVWIRFISTHKEYDRIGAKKI